MEFMYIFAGLVSISVFIAIIGAVAGTVSYVGAIAEEDEEDDF